MISLKLLCCKVFKQIFCLHLANNSPLEILDICIIFLRPLAFIRTFFSQH